MVAINRGKLADVSSLSTEDLIEIMGGAKRMLEEDESDMERRRRLDGMLEELTKQYPDQWAALTESGDLLIATSLEELRTKFKELDTRPGSNVIEFLDTNPTRWIF